MNRNNNWTDYNRIAVIGLGFVGLPLALSFCLKGIKVTGVDVEENLIRELSTGITHHLEKCGDKTIQEILREQLDSGNFQATTDSQGSLREINNYIVTVGIPVESEQHSLEHIESVSRNISRVQKKGDLVLIRSTVVPGTVRNYIAPILEESGLKAGEDFYLAYASERSAEGHAVAEFENMPTLVSGINEESATRAARLLKIVTRADIHTASSIEVVETAKIFENLSRDINIAMVNEFARFTRSMGLNIFEVIELANTHKRVNLLYPGPGVGGYCIPNAFYYLLPKAQEMGIELPVSETARRTNQEVPEVVAEMALKNLTTEPGETKICILGMAMKDYSSDHRMSPALEVINYLQAKGVRVSVYDPAVPRGHPCLVDSLEEALEGAQGIMVMARQREIDFKELPKFRQLVCRNKPFILDTKNVYNREEVESLGFKFLSL